MSKRIDFHILWMTMAFAVSQKSIDNSTKHGSIIIDDDNKLLSMGYNSFPRNCIDDSLTLDRPDKYELIIHSEVNAIINANISLKNSIIYVTGHPCPRCFGSMINAGIKKVIYGHVGSHCISERDISLIKQMNLDQNMKNKIELIKYDKYMKMEDIFIFLENIKEYMEFKIDNNYFNG